MVPWLSWELPCRRTRMARELVLFTAAGGGGDGDEKITKRTKIGMKI